MQYCLYRISEYNESNEYRNTESGVRHGCLSCQIYFPRAVDDHKETRKHTSVCYCLIYAHLQKCVVGSVNGTIRIKSENNLTKIL